MRCVHCGTRMMRKMEKCGKCGKEQGVLLVMEEEYASFKNNPAIVKRDGAEIFFGLRVEVLKET